MSQHRFPNVVTLALLCAGLTGLAGAQSGNASLHGTVYDSQHHAVAGVDVSLHATTSIQIWKTHSDSSGAFTFPALPDGNYAIRAEGLQRKAASASVMLAARETKTIDLTLSDSELAFFDEPTFSVAGVTDTTNLGGHGSDTVVRTKNALAKATVSLSKDPSHVSANPTAMESALREAQHRDPTSFTANYRLGKFLVERGRDAEAKSFLARASEIELAKNSLSASDKGGLHHLLGDVAEDNGDPLAAVHEYQRAAELDPNETNIFDWGAELLLHHAPEPATEVFSNGSRLFPRSVRMRVGLGVAWYVRGSYEEAERWLCEATDRAPNDPTPYLFLGKILSAESSVSTGAAERFARFAERQPQNAMANYYFAMSLWKQRKNSEDAEIAARVQALLEKAVSLDPKLSEAFLQLGIVHSERKDFPRAIAAYEQAIQANPRMEQAHYRLAQAYRLSGQNDKAQNELKLYEEISKQKTTEVERERSDVKQFVYTLRGETSSPARP
jgi:tetratricopeptide (TPR) repeat protein